MLAEIYTQDCKVCLLAAAAQEKPTHIYMIPARGPQTKFLYDLCRRIVCARYIGTFYNTFAHICYQCLRVMLAVDRMLVRCCMINAYVYCH